jgi:uncharacterized protein (DUF1778 family)
MTAATKETRLIIRCSEKEKALFEKAADARGLSLSAWVRMIALDAAKKETKR